MAGRTVASEPLPQRHKHGKVRLMTMQHDCESGRQDAPNSRGTRWCRLAVTLAIGLISACALPRTPDAEEKTSDAGVQAAPGQLSLSVQQARRAIQNGHVAELQLSVTLSNGAGAPSVPLNPLLFDVRTSDGLFHQATTGAHAWVDGGSCAPTLSVGEGASYQCALIADLGDSQAPVEVRYRTPNAVASAGGDQRSATAAFAVEPCVNCGSVCTYSDRDTLNCGACGVEATPCVAGSIECEAQLTPCPSKTGFICTDLTSDRHNCGGCGRSISDQDPLQFCDNGAVGCLQPFSLCGETCVETSLDVNHCGACGRVCSATQNGTPFCRSASCGVVLAKPPYSTATCTSLCQNAGLQCVEGSPTTTQPAAAEKAANSKTRPFGFTKTR